MNGEEEIYILVNRQLIKLICKEIIYLEADDNYFKIYTTFSPIPYMVRGSLKDAQKMIPSRLFVRVHRSYIVGLYQVKHFTMAKVDVGVRVIPMTARYAQNLNSRFTVLGVFYK